MGTMKNSRYSLELLVLHIIKNEGKVVGSNSLGIGGEGVIEFQEMLTFYLLY